MHDLLQEMKEIGLRLATQDNRITQDPMFEVRDGGGQRWPKVVTYCLTESAAQAYIDANRHNMKNPTIYATSLYRNYEMIAIRKFLMELAKEEVPHV